MTYQRIPNMSNTEGVTSETGVAYPPVAPELYRLLVVFVLFYHRFSVGFVGPFFAFLPRCARPLLYLSFCNYDF